MLGAGRSTATARADIGARYSSPDGEAWVRGLRTRVMTYVVLDDDVDWEFTFDSRLGHPTAMIRISAGCSALE